MLTTAPHLPVVSFVFVFVLFCLCFCLCFDFFFVLFLSLSHLLAVQGSHPLLHLLLAQQAVTRGAVGVLQGGLEFALIFIIDVMIILMTMVMVTVIMTRDRCPGGHSGSNKLEYFALIYNI